MSSSSENSEWKACLGCRFGKWRRGFPASATEPPEEGGWYCQILGVFYEEREAPNECQVSYVYDLREAGGRVRL